MSSPRILLLSSTKLHGHEMLQWCCDTFKSFLARYDVETVLFVPYAVRDYDGYSRMVNRALEMQGLKMESIHEKEDPVAAVNACEAIFVGGGNTFLLLKTLYDNKLIKPIRDIVLNKGIPYIGSSAGTNVATCSISTTNDMPITYPPSFEALNLVPFNINPHYIEPDENSTHMGETRDQRIKEYLSEPDSCPVVLGLKEGVLLQVENGKVILKGTTFAKLFKKDKEPTVYLPESDLTFLLDVRK